MEEAIASKRLVEILRDWSQPEGAIWALYPHNRYMSARVRLFVDFLSEFLANRERPKTRRRAKAT